MVSQFAGWEGGQAKRAPHKVQHDPSVNKLFKLSKSAHYL